MTRAEGAALARDAKAAAAPSLAERFWSKVDRRSANECWPWRASARKADEGYGAFWFKGRHHAAPRIAWMLTHDEMPVGLHVCHRCDNPPCCNPSHLFLGSNRDNVADKIAKDRHARGQRNGCSQLTEDQVREIRNSARPRTPYGYRAELAERFGVKPGTITDIWSGRCWKHI